MADEVILRGHCLCGACRFELEGPANWVGHCHCESCRRATASPFTTWIGQQNGRWRMTGEMGAYQSRPGRRRGFCASCGTPMYYETEELPQERHFYAALLERPEDVEPLVQFHAEEHLGWIGRALSLPEE